MICISYPDIFGAPGVLVLSFGVLDNIDWKTLSFAGGSEGEVEAGGRRQERKGSKIKRVWWKKCSVSREKRQGGGTHNRWMD